MGKNRGSVVKSFPAVMTTSGREPSDVTVPASARLLAQARFSGLERGSLGCGGSTPRRASSWFGETESTRTTAFTSSWVPA